MHLDNPVIAMYQAVKRSPAMRAPDSSLDIFTGHQISVLINGGAALAAKNVSVSGVAIVAKAAPTKAIQPNGQSGMIRKVLAK